jgi:predicted Zn-dependent protease
MWAPQLYTMKHPDYFAWSHHQRSKLRFIEWFMRRRRWQVVLVGAFLLFGLTLAAQECQNTQSHVVEGRKVKHRSAIDNIEAIGSRSMGTRGFGNWYSLEQEIDMGRDYSRKIESSSKLLKDPVVTEYVNRIGQNIVRNSDAKVPFTIKVVDSEEVNAFALPGGFLYVNNGLILYAQGEAELAAVMAHEIAHVAAHHASRQMTRSQLLNLGTIPLIFLGGGAGLAVQQAVGLMIPMSLTKFSRGFEMEADYLGVEYLYKAGYDPQAFVSFCERIQALEKQKSGLISKAFSDHPQTADRIRKTQAEIAKILPPRDVYILSTSEFEDVKAHLVNIERRYRAGERDPSRPILRRRPPAD